MALFFAAVTVLSSSPSCSESTPLTEWPRTTPPQLDLPALDGARVDPQAHKGRVVLVHFFATWCEPCRTELPALDRLVSAMGAEIAVLAISVAEPDERVRRYFAASPAGFPILLDSNRSASRAWEVFTLPTTVVLDHQLKPRLRADGEVAWDEPGVRATVQKVAAEAASARKD